jgi:uncharacterized protein (DUF362 family)
MAVLITGQQNEIKQSVRAIFNYFKGDIDFSKGVFLKPNIVFPVNARSGEITRLNFIQSIVEVLRKDFGVTDIVIGEGTAAGTVPHVNFKVSGYSNLAKKLNVDLLDLHEAERVTLKWKYGTIDLPKIIFDRAYINLPILKSSSAAIMSGAMKNQKGLLSPETKKRFHRLGLHEPIAALAAILQPSLTIMDGYNFFQNDLLMGGTSLYEIDNLAAKLLKIEEPEYLRVARQYGLGKEKYEVLGRESIKLNTKKNGYTQYKRFLRLGLWSNPRACSMCRFTLERLKHAPENEFINNFVIYMKLFKCMMKGTDFIFGTKPEYSDNSRVIVCIGDCTKKIAQARGYTHVPGCPPTPADMAKHL